MKTKHPPLTVVRLWQHLEFFQWFSQTMNAKRVNHKNWNNADPRQICIKTCSAGIGIVFSKNRGAELVESCTSRNGKPSWELYQAESYHNHPLNFDNHAPRYGQTLPPDIDGRIAWWNSLRSECTDIRKAAALAVILNWQSNPVHPTRR